LKLLIGQSDVVLNCSISEGGMPNSVLEALATGRPVLASDIEGNRSLVEDGVTGFLFRDVTELEANAERLAADRSLRERLGLAGRQLVERRYPPRREIEGYLGVYARLAPVASAGSPDPRQSSRHGPADRPVAPCPGPP